MHDDFADYQVLGYWAPGVVVSVWNWAGPRYEGVSVSFGVEVEFAVDHGFLNDSVYDEFAVAWFMVDYDVAVGVVGIEA